MTFRKILDVLKVFGKIAAIMVCPILVDNAWFMKKIGYDVYKCPMCNRDCISLDKK